MKINIKKFDEKYQKNVENLVLSIQNNEFFLGLTAQDQPDLPNIKSFYQDGGGEFWVAIDANDKVVGCIGIEPLDKNDAVLRKMFLDKAVRGNKEINLAQQLCDVLIAHAKQENLKYLWLDTPPPAHAAHRFYERNGFIKTALELLPTKYKLPKVPDLKIYKLEL